jgi:GNAT superfamily N-acetyltransferase
VKKVDWVKFSLHSEIEFSKALRGRPVRYKTFTHIHNDKVPWAGDFNRTVGVKISDFYSFEKIIERVENIHRVKNLERPNRYDIYPPPLARYKWSHYLSKIGYKIATALFFVADVKRMKDFKGYELYIPSQKEYIGWFRNQQKSRDYYEEKWFNKLLPLRVEFIKTFKPYWLIHKHTMKGWVYCANFAIYSRLFEVEIKEKYCGQNLGRILLELISIEAKKHNSQHILLQSNERLRKFYEKVGFQECTRNSVIWKT